MIYLFISVNVLWWYAQHTYVYIIYLFIHLLIYIFICLIPIHLFVYLNHYIFDCLLE